MLYSAEIQKDMSYEQIETFIESNDITDDKQKKYIINSFNGIEENKNEIIELIEKNLKQNWSISRISKIDISILKLAIYEMLYTDVPYKVAINEVVELAKKYSDESASVFINGILASVVKEKNLENKEV